MVQKASRMWAFYLSFTNAYMHSLRSVTVWGKQVLVSRMRLSGSPLLQHSEELEPNRKHNKNDTISVSANISMWLQHLKVMGGLFQLSHLVMGWKRSVEGAQDERAKLQPHSLHSLPRPTILWSLFTHDVIILHLHSSRLEFMVCVRSTERSIFMNLLNIHWASMMHYLEIYEKITLQMLTRVLILIK